MKPLLAEEVTVLLSQDISIYREALSGFKKIYKGEIREFNFKGDPKEAIRLIPEIKRHPGDIIISIGLLASQTVRDNIKETPVVFCMVYYPERFSFFTPNMTGVRLEVSSSETFSMIKMLFPGMKRVGVIYDPKKTGRVIGQDREIAKNSGLSLIPFKITSEKDLPEVLKKLPGNIDLLWMLPDSTVVTSLSINAILLNSFQNNIPIVTFSGEFVEKGAIAALSSDNEAIGEEVGRLATKIIEGEFPSSFPIHSISKSLLFINLKVANKMGIKIAPEATQKADKIYE